MTPPAVPLDLKRRYAELCLELGYPDASTINDEAFFALAREIREGCAKVCEQRMGYEEQTQIARNLDARDIRSLDNAAAQELRTTTASPVSDSPTPAPAAPTSDTPLTDAHRHLERTANQMREALEQAEGQLRDGGTFPIKGETWGRCRTALAAYDALKEGE